MKKKVFRIISISGSIMAFHIGSGFASGQEILQFYTAYGPAGGLLMGMASFVLFAVFAFVLLDTGRKNAGIPPLLLYRNLAGNVIGRFFYWITPLIMSMVLFVTIAGGGTALNEIFGISLLAGRILITVPVLLTVLLGLRWITALAGSIGPIIIVCALGLGCIGIWCGRDTMLWTLLPHTSQNWGISAISYACFGTVTQIPFLLTVGAQLDDRREAGMIAFLGNGCYMFTGVLLHFGLYRSLPRLMGEQLPLLELARRLSSYLGWFYGVVLLFGIYTTAVPLLWSVCRTIHPDETSSWYRCGAFLLCTFAAMGSALPFDRLLGVLYPYIGYISAIFFLSVLGRRILLKPMGVHSVVSRASKAV